MGFFVHESELKGGEGFALFGWQHLLALGLSVLAIALAARWYRTKPERTRRRVGLGIGIALLALEALKDAVLLLTGHFDWCYLPFQLCGLSLFIEFAYSVRPRPWLGEIMYALCMPGAAAALLFPNWNAYPPLCFYALHSQIIHTLLAGYVVMLLASGDLRPSAKRLWCCAVFLLAVAPPLYFLNHRLDTNFMFLNWPSPGSPLVFFEKLFGTPGYLLGYPIMMAVAWTLMYLPFALRRRKRAGAKA